MRPQVIFANRALLGTQWEANVRVALEHGRIVTVAEGVKAQPDDVRVDSLLPALSNVHSHSFQRGMAGMTEHRAPGRDSFWTWREVMYRFLDHLLPWHVEAIAGQAFVEMQEAGFAAVGEFHYLHHQKGGAHYSDLAEMSNRIFAAAMTTGIGLTHLPVLYCHGGAGRKPIEGGQLRFGNNLDAFSDLLQLCQTHAKALPPDTVVGVAPHSLRATDAELLKAVPALAAGSPVHIHIAEQPKEVADIEAWLGQRPVQWLLSHVPVDKTWCTIHATHMKDDEVQRLAATNAVAGLCPVTEANLGDGVFPGPQWLAAGGAFAVGTDSNVNISMVEELRTLEYGQRLRDMARNVMIPETGSVGAFLYRQAATGSAQALQRNAGVIAEGKLADLLAINSQHVSLCALSENALLDGLCFASRPGIITDVWSAGRHAVKAGRHVARQAVEEQYRKAMHDIVALL